MIENAKSNPILPALAGDGTTDDTAAIQARFDSGADVVRLPPAKVAYLISRPLRIGSNQELKLDPTTVVRLAPMSDCSMVENRCYASGQDCNIALIGGIWDMDNLRQSKNPWHDPDRQGKMPDHHDPNWWLGIALRFCHVRNLRIEGLTIRNPTTYGLELGHVSDFLVRDIVFDYRTWNPIPLNMDGVHCDGFCDHGRILNLRGTCYDDMVALNANDEICSPEEGPIHDMEIDGLDADYCHSAVRILSAGAPVRKVSIRNVRGRFYTYGVGLTHFFPGRPRGRFDDITIENVAMSKAIPPEGLRGWRERLAIVDVEGTGDVGRLVLKNLVREEENLPAPTIAIGKAAVVEDLVVQGGRMVNGIGQPIRFLDKAGLLFQADFSGVSFEGNWEGREPDYSKPERGMYFATHFGNWYQHATDEELEAYIGELKYWGCNLISVWFDMHEYRGMADPKARKQVALLRRILGFAKKLGLRTDLCTVANEAFDDSPKELRADWTGGHDGYPDHGLESHYHREICPEKEGGLEHILAKRREVFDAFKDLVPDSLATGPYDQGGCTCSKCAPWGGHGFPKLAEKVCALFRETVNPWGERELSTWNFGQHPDDWPELLKQKEHLISWVDVMNIAPQDVHILEADPFIPFISMSEISMNEMLPWGGCGANPLPERFQKELTAYPHLRGLRPYSEGIYEDLNKVMELAVLSGKAKTTVEAIGLYADRYFGEGVAPLLQEAVTLMEKNCGHWVDLHQGDVKANFYQLRAIDRSKPWTVTVALTAMDAARAKRVSELMGQAEALMTPEAKASWRWRVLKIRADVDLGLSEGKAVSEMAPLFEELAKIYKVGPDTSILLVPPSERLLKQADSFLFVPDPE